MTDLPLVDWLLTCTLHATVVLLFASLPRLSLALREGLLRLALFASPLTAAMQVWGGARSLLGGLWPQAEPGQVGALAAAPSLPATDALPAVLPGPPASVLEFDAMLLPALIALACCGLAQLAWVSRAERRRLAGRTARADLQRLLRPLAARLGLSRPPRISTSDRVAVPVAFGVWNPEVCLPPRALRELPARQRRAVLAHEMAHLRRGDPAWTIATEVLCRLLPLLPTAWIARARLRRTAELGADEMGAAACGEQGALAMARCLVQAADWLQARPPRLSHAMARSSGELRRRIERLLADPTRPATVLGPRLRAAVLSAAASGAWWLPQLHAPPPELVAAPAPAVAVDLALAFPELAAAADELAALHAEFASLRELVTEAAIDDPEIGRLLGLLADRLDDLNTRCRALQEAARAQLRVAPTQPPPTPTLETQ